ncbi:MAG: glycosyltransferase [Planctomycetaceae bacterium]|jgi:glycosyltransferase involved in cell wall biosynthesis
MFVSGTLSGGGAERFVSTLLQHLGRDRVQPSLCLFRDEIAYPLAGDVEVSILGHQGPLSAWRSVRRLSETIDRVRPDIVVSVMDYLGMFVGEALRTCRSQPVWVARTSNNPEFQFRSVRGRCRKQWLKRVYPRADVFVANSDGLSRSFQETFPCARGRTRVLSNPVDVARIRRMAGEEWPEAINSEVPNLFYSARLRPQKRPDVLIEAFRIVRRHSPAKLWICGEGPLRGKLETLIEKYQLRPHVRMVGFRENTFPLLKAATVAVATSDYEGLPNNVLEAQALGVPVVSTRSSFGPEEIIQHEETGLLTDPGNPGEVARAIIRVLSDDRLRSDMAHRARIALRQRFGLETTIPRWQALLEEFAPAEIQRAA